MDGLDSTKPRDPRVSPKLRPPDHRSSGAPAPAVAPAASVDVEIEYCEPGNHERVACRLAEVLRKECGVEVRLVPSRDGVFEVCVNGKLVFSKRATTRFPGSDEIIYHVQNPPPRQR